MNRRTAQRSDSEIVVFGRHPVGEALRSEGVEVLELASVKNRSPADRKALRQLAHRHRIPHQEVSRAEMDRRTGAPRHDQGVAARVRLLHVMELEAFLAGLTGERARHPVRVLGLDGVTNSQNVGMIVRSVVGAGLDGFLWPASGQPWINGLVVRASSGAIFECPILRCESIELAVPALQGAGFSTVGLDAAAASSLFESPPAHRAAYVLGGEAQGLSDSVRGMLDQLATIPMGGRLESLNVAVAAGLVAFHAAGLLSDGAPK